MGLYEVPLSMSLLGFGMGTMLANFHMCGIMLLLGAVLNKLMRNASPRGPMCFRCMTPSLPVPWSFSLSFISSLHHVLLRQWIRLSCVLRVRKLSGERIRSILKGVCHFVA